MGLGEWRSQSVATGCWDPISARRESDPSRSDRLNLTHRAMASKILIIAGPNGAGKTTFAREYLPNEADCDVFVNADLIAAGLAPFRPATAAIQSGRLMLREIDTHARLGRNFAFETTLAGRTYVRRIREWRANGYRVKLIFLALAAPEEAIARVRVRASQGGHALPEAVIRRRFDAGLRNFRNVYRQEVDCWQQFNASGPELVLESEGGSWP